MPYSPTQTLSARLARLTTRHPMAVVGVALLLTAVSGLALRSLRIQANLFALLPDSLPAKQNLQRVYDKTGGFGDLVILVEGGDQKRADAYFAALLPAVRKLSWVRRADYTVDLDKLRPYAALYMDLEDLKTIRLRLQKRLERAVGADLDLDDDAKPQKLRFDDIAEKYKKRAADRHPFSSKDGTLRAMRIFPMGQPTSNLKFGRKAIGDLQRLVDQRAARARSLGLTVTVAGKFWNRVQDYYSVIRDLKRSVWWGAALILLLLALYFRHVLAVPLLLLPLGMSMSWTFAIARLTVGELNVITAFLFVILLGLGIDFGVHLFARYRLERLEGREVEPAIAATLSTSGRACWTAGLTTAAAFASLLITDFKGFSQFGLIASVGVSLAFFANSLVLPALLVLVERWGLIKLRARPGDGRSAAERRAAPLSTAARRALTLAVAAGVGMAVLGGVWTAQGRLGFEYDFEKLNTLPKDVIRVKEKVTRIFGYSANAAVVFAGSLEEAAALTHQIRAHMATDRTPTIERVLSLNDMLPRDQTRKLAVIREIRGLLAKRAVRKAVQELPEKQRTQIRDLERDTVTRPMTYRQLPKQLSDPFMGLPGVRGTKVIIYPLHAPRDARFAAQFQADTLEYRTAAHTYHPASEAVIFAEVIRILRHDGRVAIVATLLTVFLLLFVDFRRLGYTLLAFTPLTVAVGWLLLVMVSWPYDLNMYNLVVLPSLIGLGVDSSVHMTHRWIELGPGRMKDVLGSILGPIAVSSLTTMIGFGGMLAAHQAGLRSLGTLAVLGMGLSMLSVGTLMPALLLVLEGGRRARRAGRDAPQADAG